MKVLPFSVCGAATYQLFIDYTPIDNKKDPKYPEYKFLCAVSAGAVASVIT